MRPQRVGLAVLAPWHRIAFAVSCVEVPVPSYAKFSELAEVGDPDLVRATVDAIWSLLAGSETELVGSELVTPEAVGELLPDEDDWNEWAPQAEDAIASLIYLLELARQDDVDKRAKGSLLAMPRGLHRGAVPSGRIQLARNRSDGMVGNDRFAFIDAAVVGGDGAVAVMADRFGGGRRVAAASGEPLEEVATRSPVTGGVATDSAGDLVAIGCADGITRLWRAGSAHLDDLPARDSKVSSVAVSSDSNLVGSGHVDGTVDLYDTITRSRRTIDTNVGLDVGFHRSVRAIVFDDKGGSLVTAGHSGAVRVWETSTGQLLATLREPGQVIGAMAVSPSGRLIAIGDVKGKLELLDRHSGETWALAGHVDSVLALTFGIDDRMLVSGGRDRFVKIWDTAAGAGPIEMTDLNGWVRSVEFSANGAGITAVDGGGTVAVWGVDGSLRSLSKVAPDSLDHTAGRIDGPRSWLHEASLHDWGRINCGCGRGAAHVPSDFARLVAAKTDDEADGNGLIDDVEMQNMLFEAIVPLMPMAILALFGEPLSGLARHTMLELVLAGVSGDTDYVEQRLGRENLEDLCRDAIRPHVPFLRSLMSSGASSQEQGLLHEILMEFD